eukprot:CAMPEP_0119393672 /NCGR_PEP_ID=MMETSP1334-20130426/126221_1 /TAXON_ID=127549 /ORGANISM="Calcidiscus leptoporus, Strain RCC1130" /LENGTH=59 /DNA_ID=CAMNT_0007416783 /DNA_START=13 /DNA_END=188 /DNA_ORIENTATION=+
MRDRFYLPISETTTSLSAEEARMERIRPEEAVVVSVQRRLRMDAGTALGGEPLPELPAG